MSRAWHCRVSLALLEKQWIASPSPSAPLASCPQVPKSLEFPRLGSLFCISFKTSTANQMYSLCGFGIRHGTANLGMLSSPSSLHSWLLPWLCPFSEHISHTRRHTLLLHVLHFLLILYSFANRSTLSWDFSIKISKDGTKECFKHLWNYIPVSRSILSPGFCLSLTLCLSAWRLEAVCTLPTHFQAWLS